MRFTASTRSQSSGSYSTAAPRPPMPALLTSTSTRPPARLQRDARPCRRPRPSGSRRARPSERDRVADSAHDVVRPRCRAGPRRRRRRRRRAKPAAIARPSPLAAPVTTATRPASEKSPKTPSMQRTLYSPPARETFFLEAPWTPPKLCARYRKLYMPAVCDALYELGLPEQVLPTWLRPLFPEQRVAGVAFTVLGRAIEPRIGWDDGIEQDHVLPRGLRAARAGLDPRARERVEPRRPLRRAHGQLRPARRAASAASSTATSATSRASGPSASRSSTATSRRSTRSDGGRWSPPRSP